LKGTKKGTKNTGKDSLEVAFASDEWFRRGWTLQELLAPELMYFYDTDWALIGEKAKLHTTLSKTTGIDAAVLRGTKKLSECSIAERMSWASNRETKRIEDIAYCLLGIFDVNMPLLYGERGKAFLRLQEEIIRQSTDESIFAWQDERLGFAKYQPDILGAEPRWRSLGCHQKAAAYIQEQIIRTAIIDRAQLPTDEYSLELAGQGQTLSSMLAKSPKAFQYAGNIVESPHRVAVTNTFTLTHRGLKIKRHLKPWSPYTYFLPLNCLDLGRECRLIGILLRRIRGQKTQYARVQAFGEQVVCDIRSDLAVEGVEGIEEDTVYVPRPLPPISVLADYVYGFHIDVEGLEISPDRLKTRGQWIKKSSIVFLNPGDENPNDVCGIDLDRLGLPIKTFKLGFDRNFVPFCIASKWEIPNEYLALNDKDRSLRNSSEAWKPAGDIAHDSARHFLPVAGQPGLWILGGQAEVFDHVYYLSHTGNVEDILAKVSLQLQTMSSDYRMQPWLIWTVKLEFKDIVSKTARTQGRQSNLSF